MKLTRFALVFTLALALISSLSPRSLYAQAPLRLGILGDSGSDEYRGTDNRGGAYANVTLNWAEQLVRLRGVSLGPWGTRPEPRRTGFAYNWARSGATTDTMISQGQHTGLAAQVANGEIDLVIMQIGANDFAFYNMEGGYDAIYSGELSGAALDAKINRVIDNIRVALDTVLSARRVPIIVAEITDWNSSPTVFTNPQYSDPVKRQRVTDATERVNVGIRTLAAQRGLTVVKSNAIADRIFGNLDANGIFLFSGVPIDLLTPGDEPHHAILSDRIHAGTVTESILANFYIQAIATLLPGRLQPISDAEVLAFVGLSPSVSPTLTPVLSTVTPLATVAANTRTPVATRTSTPTRTRTPTFTRTPLTVSTRTPTATRTRTPTATRTRISTAIPTVVTNHPPVAGDDTFMVQAGSYIIFSLAQIQSNDTDPEGDVLTIVAATFPSHGRLVQYGANSGAYVPDAGFSGTDSMTYTVSDGHGGSDTATIFFVVR